jgi:hypothetical protein
MISLAGSANRPGADLMPRMPSSAATRWRAVIDDFHQAGLKQAEFCRRRGLSLHSFRKYLYGSQPATAATPPAKFLPLTTLAEIAQPEQSDLDPIVLILPCGRRVAVGPGFDADTLGRLLDVLGNRP